MSHKYIEAVSKEHRLKLQAWIDGQLPSDEASRVADWVEAKPAARELVEELRVIKVTLRAGELSVAVEESREFYWTQIAQYIDVEKGGEPVFGVALPWMEWCRQWLVPVGGLVAIVLIIATVDIQPDANPMQKQEGDSVVPSSVSPYNITPISGPPAFKEGSDNGEVPAEDVNVLNLNITPHGSLNMQPSLNERTIPSIENPER